ncbi:MAG: GDP-mannose 4,6-dehydratase [Spirochaetes bacterium]|nr:GDP-mannose 4,6-dehydratase [Spirochaetota bacterium]
MNILLTGAAGFVAYKTAELLLQQGHRVIGIDNMNDYYDVQLKAYRRDLLIEKSSNFSFIECDIENIERVRQLFKKEQFDAVINLAARAGVRYSIENPIVYMTTNAVGTLNLLELMREFKIKKLVLASTSSLYAGLPMPFTEDLPVNEPISPYAASKKAAEAIAYTYHYLYNIDVSVLRYFTVFGPAGRPDMSPFRFIQWIINDMPIEIFGDGTQARDFTYVDDIAEGTVKALKSVDFEIINLGGGNNPISLLTMIELMETYIGKKARLVHKPFHKADMKKTWADISKAERILGWKPKISFEEGIRRTVEWHINEQEWVKKVRL